MSIAVMTNQVSFTSFLNSLKQTFKSAFYEIDNIEEFVQKRGFPDLVLKKIMAANPFSVAIPTVYGGRGVKVKECLGVLDAASYESLPLSLAFGINIGLFLEPVAKYADESIKKDIFNRFMTQQNMGGLMITEPDHGSDALNMKTTNVKKGPNYHIQGTKHWQGLTGMADYWLMTSRQKFNNGDLARDIDFFICDEQQPNQVIQVAEYYNNIGLYPIPYGKNIIDIHVPEQFKLKPETTGLKLMMDLLHRSRFQFPGMGMGFIRRMLDEAIDQTTSRFVGGKSLMSLDQVKHQVSRIQSAYTVSSAMCSRSAGFSGIENNLADSAVEANSMKAYITDLMQESAQTLTQLKGANGYKTESVGSRGIMDSRPFQIFEGSNEMLYTQISEMVIKLMGRNKIANLSEFLKNYHLTENIADYFKSLLDFKVDINLQQRKIVDLGKIISRVISANHVAILGAKGFRSDLIGDSLESIKHEISMLVSSYKFKTTISPIEEYKDKSSWLAFC
ncbi:MAG: acyl-CoA/acyl-ACP dehydrogenase [Bacteroidetes bacterium]|nr:acyl-CoA/acyl-ACP dehydrogenase [Bacteroidota bacterium]